MLREVARTTAKIKPVTNQRYVDLYNAFGAGEIIQHHNEFGSLEYVFICPFTGEIHVGKSLNEMLMLKQESEALNLIQTAFPNYKRVLYEVENGFVNIIEVDVF